MGLKKFFRGGKEEIILETPVMSTRKEKFEGIAGYTSMRLICESGLEDDQTIIDESVHELQHALSVESSPVKLVDYCQEKNYFDRLKKPGTVRRGRYIQVMGEISDEEYLAALEAVDNPSSGDKKLIKETKKRLARRR